MVPGVQGVPWVPGGHLLPPLASSFLVLVEESVVIFALRYIFRSVALLGELVVDQPQLAALFSGGDSVEADEELGAVVGVGVLGVRVELSELVSRSVGRALEPISRLQSVSLSLALLPVGGLGPVADAAVLVEPEAGGAGVLLCLAVNTGVEDVADGRVGVGVEAVEARAEVAGTLWLLELQPVSTVHIEVMITWLSLP